MLVWTGKAYHRTRPCCARHIKYTGVVYRQPKILHGVCSHLFVINLFSTLQTIIIAKESLIYKVVQFSEKVRFVSPDTH